MVRKFALTLLAPVILCGAPDCEKVTSQPFQFSFCKPKTWLVDLGLKGIPYLCSKRVTTCTGYGGFPRPGLALLQLVPLEASGYATTARTPEELIQEEESRGQSPILRLTMRWGEKTTLSVKADGISAHYVRLERQSFGDPAETIFQERYIYAVSIDNRLFWVFLQFWSDDRRAKEYIETADNAVRSIRLVK